MKALLVYPEYPPLTYWSFSHALPYLGRRAALPPLGLITVAAMLPEHWELRLIDLNVEPLRDADLLWADVVMTSTMVVQAESLDEVVARCNRLGVPVVAGGPHPSGTPDSLKGVDHIFIGEAEQGLRALVEDLENGCAKPRYRAEEYPDVGAAPVPRFDLLDSSAYASMAVQHSRGCPFACEFCDIWKLYGRRPRVKSPEALRAELDALEAIGWSGSVFFVDDNFIGNTRLAKRSLATIEEWQRGHGFPFLFYTEATLNLGSDEDLMRAMRDAGFSFVFLGIETPSADSLIGANKRLNANVDLLETVRRIQANGIEVSSGFIVGFDEDTEDIFDRQIDFIREAGIPMAMVGLLTAIQGTELYERLQREGRLLGESDGNNTHHFNVNFETRMPADKLVAGYKRVMRTIYDPTLKNYFDRCRRLLERMGPNPYYARRMAALEVLAFLRSLRTIPLRRYGRQYLRFLLWSAIRRREYFPEAVRLAIMGFHFETITRHALECDGIRHESSRLASRFRDRFAALTEEALRRPAAQRERLRAIAVERTRALRDLRRRIRRLTPEVRDTAAAAYGEFLHGIDALFAEHGPRAAAAIQNGSRHLAHVRESLSRDVEAMLDRYARAWRRAGAGVENIHQELRELHRDRRELVQRARRRIRRLPREYRLLGRFYLIEFQRRLEALPEVASA